MTKHLGQWFTQVRNRGIRRSIGIGSIGLAVVGTATLLATSLPLLGQQQPIPSPEEAARQATQLSPTELTQLTIDAEIRDRLRFDPRWQPIAAAIRQDLMILKWGNHQLSNPAWERYGAQAYPLLAYYTRSQDATRQDYGMAGIRQLGQPYTTLWLEQQLQQNPTTLDFSGVTVNPTLLIDPNAPVPYEWNWQQEFGLDNAQTRDRLIQMARANLQADASAPSFYNQFNLQFLIALLGDAAVLPPPSPPAPFNPALDPALGEWNQLEPIAQPTQAQVQQAIALYNTLNPKTQEYLLVRRLGAAEAGKISPLGKILLQHIANTNDAPDRVWAIAELDRHGDAQGRALLQDILNGELSQLYRLTREVSYGNSFYQPDDRAARSNHAYYLLIGIAEQYPQSKFIQAARAYGELTGRYYFGGELRNENSLRQFAQKTPAQRVTDWQNWLAQYPDHPGADDATYFLARALQDDQQVMAAMDLWIKLMTQPIGDGDASYLAYPQVRTMLDVGLTTAQLETLVSHYQGQAIAPLLGYALAVRYARSHDYAKALATSEGLDFTSVTDVLNSYYKSSEQDFLSSYYYRNQPQPIEEMQTMLTEQRSRWQTLQTLQADNTPAGRYQLAAHWVGEGGWKNGYLAVWEGNRTYLLPTGDWGTHYCEVFWACNSQLRGAGAVKTSYQQASQNAIALSLYGQILEDNRTSEALREKAIYMTAYTLLSQWEDYPVGETFRIHPPAGVPASLQAPNANPTDAYQIWQLEYPQLERNYLQQLDQAIAQLKRDFPQSTYIDDLLFSRYAMSGQLPYLEEIVNQYPQGDRAAEASFLLANRRSR